MAEGLHELAARLDRLRDMLDGTQLRQITTRVAGKAKTAAAGAITPNTLSHWGKSKKGYVVRARYTIKTDSTAVIAPTIPPLAALLTFGGKGPWKTPKRRGGARRKRGASTYNRAPVPGRDAWIHGANKVAEVPPGLVHDEVTAALRKTFGGS